MPFSNLTHLKTDSSFPSFPFSPSPPSFPLIHPSDSTGRTSRPRRQSHSGYIATFPTLILANSKLDSPQKDPAATRTDCSPPYQGRSSDSPPGREIASTRNDKYTTRSGSASTRTSSSHADPRRVPRPSIRRPLLPDSLESRPSQSRPIRKLATKPTTTGVSASGSIRNVGSDGRSQGPALRTTSQSTTARPHLESDQH